MILIFGNWPENPKEFEGMVLRIRDLDQAFAGRLRVYLQFDQKFWSKPERRRLSAEQSFLRVNLKNPWHLGLVTFLVWRSQLIYAHSLLNLNSRVMRGLLQVFRSRKLAIDFHGVVPEEFAYDGKPELALRFEQLERAMVDRASVLVVVSQKMREHFLHKYRSLAGVVREWVLLPTSATTRVPALSELRPSESSPGILYSGGLQRWQNVPEVLALYQTLQAKGFRCAFFTYKLDDVLAMAKSYPKLSESWQAAHLSPAELEAEYARHDFGVVLRDAVVVNRVACPTKIMDYLAWGLIPVVKTKEIGDFREWGAPMVVVSDLPNVKPQDIARLKIAARAAFDAIQRVRAKGLERLKTHLAAL